MERSKRPSPTYRSWMAMRQRCRDPRTNGYKNYGGRGIKVCARWEHFEQFLADMGPRPSESHSIDRIDVNGDYEPDNCRWSTMEEQASNRRTSRKFTLGDETLTIAQWERKMGMKRSALGPRLKDGGSFEEVLASKRRRCLSPDELAGVVESYRAGHLQRDIADRYGITQAAVSKILYRLDRAAMESR